ncbi:MotA/TolQ/ExbB proton channel family protein [Paracoccaceae bacterium Fryx2]|nr:MotA/TolQ/ExbB proton channel family protein [Paracoccaceae bacterium Fryx2]
MVRAATVLIGVTLASGAAAQTAAALAVPHADLMELVTKAHPVVQGVMASLAFAVFVVLTVMIYKLAELVLVFSHLRRAQKALGDGLSGPAGDSPLAQAARAAQAALADLPMQVSPGLRASARERLDLMLERIDAGAVERLRLGTGVLASIGSVGPFVGLFGTVFGIMNSFLAIAATKTTNLAVVAPGIAEALLATGLGLVAAIPAVILYNHLMRRIKAYRHRLSDGLAEVQQQFSRALDARMGA